MLRTDTRARALQSTKLIEIPKHEWPILDDPGRRRVWCSRSFLVQEFAAERPALVRLSVNKVEHDGNRWLDGISWDELQGIKDQVGYALMDAVEVYPAEVDVVNVANMRHLWVLADPVSFAWRNA